MSKKSFVSLCLSLSLIFSLISVLLVKPVDAKTVRVAVVSALTGEVTVKKGGGSKTYDAYESMSLNQGDTVYTGASSSVTLNLSNGDADVTLGENAEINVSDLNTSDGNKKSKLKVWAGSLWVKVKSLAGSNDEFEVETPTAVMGVRGTQFFVMVDPVTGAIKMAVGAGKVSASTVTTGEDSEQKTAVTYLYPTQQISLDGRDETEELALKVDFLDLDDFVKQASPEVIKEFILNKAEIDKENEEFIAKKATELAEGNVTDDENLVIKSTDELDKVKQNFDNLIGNIAKKALAEKKLDQSSMDKVIADANKKISEDSKKLDLSKVKDLDKTAGVDAEKEKQKQELLKKLEAEKLKKKLEQEKKQAELKKQLEAQLKLLEEQKKKLDAATKAAEEKAKADALAKLKASEAVKPVTPPTGEGSNSGGSSGGNTNPGNPDPGTPNTPVPAVSLTATLNETGSNPNMYNLDINLKNFVESNDIYGVEVHLFYGTNTYYSDDMRPVNGTIFGRENSTNYVEHIKEYEGDGQKELVYAVTGYGDAGNIKVSDLQKLVTIPLQGYGHQEVSVGKIVIVRKNGTSVQTIPIVESSIQPVTLDLHTGV
ncbi:FecR domain-containing protein [Paenibacillus chondroitinus]|uniref:FecR domain-containing protein n=1 Tax=Paenibacillus chondroitinus TaxID=59842 RepID=A0ABU6D6P2_9BACL|nr:MULTISPECIES: FecR domain-containing protein [Paenibacillus]MCY9662507.1 FecR domain-containing protein [Paenibacillus anseongense]MEB4793378.1 FecR domain-containing protein [Paenibacillus chondroitinus]